MRQMTRGQAKRFIRETIDSSNTFITVHNLSKWGRATRVNSDSPQDNTFLFQENDKYVEGAIREIISNHKPITQETDLDGVEWLYFEPKDGLFVIQIMTLKDEGTYYKVYGWFQKRLIE